MAARRTGDDRRSDARAPRRHAAPVKPARSYEEQLSRLTRIHGLTIGDPRRAREILSTVNYYRLTTYGKHLRRADDPERFRPGVSLETLYALYRFDMGLRHAVQPVLEFFEIQLRAKISYQLAIAHGSLGYLDAANFRPDEGGPGIHKSLVNKFRVEVRRQDDLAFVRHHKEKYGGRFPVWAAVELFSFGMLATLYDIMLEGDRRAVAGDYGLTPEALSRLIRCTVDVRNICAHYSRLYGRELEEQPELPARDCGCEGSYLFPLLLALRPVAARERVWKAMIAGIAHLAKLYPEADLSLCGFPADWEKQLTRG